MVTMASSLAYVLVLMLMVCGATGYGANSSSQTCLMNTDYDRLIKKQTALESKLDQRIAAFSVISNHHSDLIKKTFEDLATIRETVVFSAKKTDKEAYKTGDIMKFTETIVNVGDGYVPLTGKFEAPSAGTYMFTVQICNNNGTDGVIFLKVANKTILSSTHRGDNVDCNSYTGTSIMKAADKAWVECSWANNVNESFANDNWRWNMFSGVRL